jgi:hypothetical protein
VAGVLEDMVQAQSVIYDEIGNLGYGTRIFKGAFAIWYRDC